MCLAYPAEAAKAAVKEHASQNLTAARLIVVGYSQQFAASRAELLFSRCHGLSCRR